MRRPSRSSGAQLLSVVLLIAASAIGARAQPSSEVEQLRREVDDLKRKNAETQQKLDQVLEMLRQIQPAKVAEKPAPAKKAARPKPDAVPRAARQEPATTPADSKAALHQAVEELDTAPAPVAAPTTTTPDTGIARVRAESLYPALVDQPLPGSARLRLLEPSLDVLMALGGSTVDDDEIRSLEGGEHDPKRSGFTFQGAEFSLMGAVDPYFTAETHIVFFPTFVELEEAFATTQRLPWNLQAELGYFLTEFGRINPTHAHAWAWIDQPVIATRLLGGDGLRSPGIQGNWLIPAPFFAELWLGVQNPNDGEFTVSFDDADGAVGNRPAVTDSVSRPDQMLYLARLDGAWNFGPNDEWSALLGFSGLFGPNSTGDDARTFIYGTDLTVKWRPSNNFRGWPYVTWQSEFMKRDYTAEPFLAGTEIGGSGSGGHGHSHGGEDDGGDEEDEFDENIPGALLRDWGFYSQLLWGFRYQWSTGVRLEYATGSGPSVGGRANDPLRDNRWRVSPLLMWQPTEFSRFRLQYNYDVAQTLPDNDASTVWLGFEFLYGLHPAHRY